MPLICVEGDRSWDVVTPRSRQDDTTGSNVLSKQSLTSVSLYQYEDNNIYL